MLNAEMNLFYDSDPINYTLVNNATFNKLVGDIIISNATPALWFYAAGGSVLVALALMSLVNRMPRGKLQTKKLGILIDVLILYADKYEWGQTISRLVMGTAIIAITAIDMNASDDVLGDNLEYEGSKIWFLATHSFM